MFQLFFVGYVIMFVEYLHDVGFVMNNVVFDFIYGVYLPRGLNCGLLCLFNNYVIIMLWGLKWSFYEYVVNVDGKK